MKKRSFSAAHSALNSKTALLTYISDSAKGCFCLIVKLRHFITVAFFCILDSARASKCVTTYKHGVKSSES
ncbi:MAG: hypothetical protein A3B25_03990 [Candidatus Ryanbacteria bacterium RIFCSPLOWO2_01_FULL_48_26]|uniref:Uncharacterized protein n=1 Tax=Candidatus Ryanbacteria bacterium RIFCSPLOWO2_01_FULL_48_26 TaxID=1802126 RepID=A0A1G2GRL7_9BACT|nr:MAG: hypothetical protein A3B25_03990 [Candidatus Ryanbacteria bacterium RIFCSPLOWO2_01_FULL_48_26]